MKLNDLAKKYDTDKKVPDGVKCRNGLFGHCYTEIYERLFKRKKVKRLLEIGVSFGGSIKMWNEYFPKAEIIGIDIEEKRFKKSELENEKVKIFIGSQNDIDFLQTLKNKYDIIIDDGSHKLSDILASFSILFDYLNKGGIYIIEDIHVNKGIEKYFKGFELKIEGSLLIIKKLK